MDWGLKIEYLGSTWMLIEVLASVWAGLLANSLALLAFGGDSLIELFSGFAVIAQLRKRTDGTSAARNEKVAAGLLFALIPTIGLGAVYSYLAGLRPEGSPVGLTIALAAVIIMPLLYLEKKRIGKETKTLALSIDAIESLTCFFMSVALVGGLLAEYFLGLWWMDYIATAAILVFVGKEAAESLHELRELE